MTEYQSSRRHIHRPAKRESVRVKLVLLAFMLLTTGGMLALAAKTGLHESILGVAFPASRLLAGARQAQAAPIPQVDVAPAALLISDMETVYRSAEVLSVQDQPMPEILIYHTHATEAYLPHGEDRYQESGKWRTVDPDSSVIAVGAALAERLSLDYGFCVLHDTTNHEPPKLSSAYSRSLVTMRQYQTRYPSIGVYIDVHRDAYGSSDESMTESRDYVVRNGEELARIMCVVGTGKGATGTGFSELPDFEANFAFADAVTQALAKTDERLTRDIRVKTGRYNQHVSSRCLLVEVGHNANTLAQALASVPYLAAAIDTALSEAAIETASLSGMDLWTP